MTKLSKEQWRRFNGIRTPKDAGDLGVLGRRELHEAIVKWEIKWLSPLHVASALSAFAFVLLPAFNSGWRQVVSELPLVSCIHHEFSTFGWWAKLALVLGLGFSMYSNSKVDNQAVSEHGYPFNLNISKTPKVIWFAELFPRTVVEERVFFNDCAAGLWLATAGWFVLLGGFSLFASP